jgi:hypothetical protein
VGGGGYAFIPVVTEAILQYMMHMKPFSSFVRCAWQSCCEWFAKYTFSPIISTIIYQQLTSSGSEVTSSGSEETLLICENLNIS